MNNYLIIVKSRLFLSYSYLRSNGIKNCTIERMVERKRVKPFRENNVSFLCYDELPLPTQSKLPSKNDLLAEYHLQQHETKVDTHFEALHFAHTKGYIKHIETFNAEYPTIERKKINVAAKLYAVWDCILESAVRDSFTLYTAFNKIYPGKYSNYNSFANAKSTATKKGAKAMAIDQRWFTTPLNIKEVNVVNQYWAAGIISIGKKYSNATTLKKLTELCKLSNEVPPSLSWVGKYRNQILKSNYSINESRNGKEAAKATQQTFAKMQHALHANTQWQMDGWTLPFWTDGFKRYVILVIMDAHSKKIVGSAVGESENTTVIMAALRNAIQNTGCLPNEIVSDNHSFNQTKEAAYFKKAIAEIGTSFTVTSNPQWKSIIERHNRHLDALCKEYYGYVGEGIKSKSINARPKQELLDKYAKTSLTEGEVLLIGAAIAENFNNEVLGKKGKTPNQVFDESEKPHCFTVSVFDRIKVLIAQTECKVSRGQITIKRGNVTHDFQLPAHLIADYNNQTVIVRYEDLKEGIYLYDKAKDEAIAEIQPKPIIHGAKADQTEKDIELLNRNKGRLNGIKAQAKKANEALTEAAHKRNPEVYTLLNKVTMPKNVLKELEENANLKKVVENEGINTKLIHIPERESELENEDFKPKSTVKKPNNAPFAPKNHVMRKVSKNDFYND